MNYFHERDNVCFGHKRPKLSVRYEDVMKISRFDQEALKTNKINILI